MYTNIYTFCTLLVHILVHLFVDLLWIIGCAMQPQCSYECVLLKTNAAIFSPFNKLSLLLYTFIQKQT